MHEETAGPKDPGGAAIVVSSQSPEGRRYLILHRNDDDQHNSGDGDWAWGPPSGCREPGEDVHTCAARELYEETGIRAVPTAVATYDIGWAVFCLEVPWDTEVRLSPGEHDRYAWVTFAEACTRCRPETVVNGFHLAANHPPEPIRETQATYDLIADEYASRNSTVYPRLLEQANQLAAGLGPNCTVADVGCGTGRELSVLRERGLRVVGLDLSLGQLRTGGHSGVVQGDMRRLPVRTGSLDAVWCQAALLHIPRPDVPGVLAEFARTVRPGGLIYLALAEGEGERWEEATNYGSTRRRWFTYHREPDLTAQLAVAGFEVRDLHRTRSYRDWLSVHGRRVPAT